MKKKMANQVRIGAEVFFILQLALIHLEKAWIN